MINTTSYYVRIFCIVLGFKLWKSRLYFYTPPPMMLRISSWPPRFPFDFTLTPEISRNFHSFSLTPLEIDVFFTIFGIPLGFPLMSSTGRLQIFFMENPIPERVNRLSYSKDVKIFQIIQASHYKFIRYYYQWNCDCLFAVIDKIIQWIDQPINSKDTRKLLKILSFTRWKSRETTSIW